MPLEKHDPELAGLEAALAALAPMPGRISRDALLFRAGQASVRNRPWAWPAVAGGLGLAAAVLAAVLIFRTAPVERVIVVKEKPLQPPSLPADLPPAPQPDLAAAAGPSTPSPGQTPMTYLQLQKQVLRWGLDGVPAPPQTPPAALLPLTREQLLGTDREPAPFTNFLLPGSFFQ